MGRYLSASATVQLQQEAGRSRHASGAAGGSELVRARLFSFSQGLILGFGGRTALNHVSQTGRTFSRLEGVILRESGKNKLLKERGPVPFDKLIILQIPIISAKQVARFTCRGRYEGA